MDKKELANILSQILIPAGFKKKGNYWVINGDVITKMVNLQKSQFSNSYYINYGYILNSIPLNGLMMHVSTGLSSLNEDENKRIKELLNLENEIDTIDRALELKKNLTEKLITKIQAVNSEEDILRGIKQEKNLNDVPGVVLKHFNLI